MAPHNRCEAKRTLPLVHVWEHKKRRGELFFFFFIGTKNRKRPFKLFFEKTDLTGSLVRGPISENKSKVMGSMPVKPSNLEA